MLVYAMVCHAEYIFTVLYWRFPEAPHGVSLNAGMEDCKIDFIIHDSPREHFKDVAHLSLTWLRCDHH